MKKFLLLCVLAITTAIRALDAPTAKPEDEKAEEKPKNDMPERLAIAEHIVRLEISPTHIDEELARGDLQSLMDELEKHERKDDLKALREATEAVTDKVVSSGRVWDEYAGRYATHFTLEELKELKELLRHPLLLKHESIRRDFHRREFHEVVFVLAEDVAATEMKKVQAVIDEIVPKLSRTRER